MILSLCQWAQNTAFFTAIRGSWNVYPAIMAIHLLGIALFGGMILITDMRLLGLATRSRSIADVVDQLRAPKRVGLLINPAALDRAAKIPGRAKLAAILSLLLWAGIACAGRAIGYVEPPLDRIHAGLFHPGLPTVQSVENHRSAR